MRKKETHNESKKRNLVVDTTYYYADDGREIAYYIERCKNGELSQELNFNSDRFHMNTNDWRDFLSRAKPQYKADVEEILKLHPGAPLSEHFYA